MGKENELTITSDSLPLSITITLKVKRGERKGLTATASSSENSAKGFLLSYFAANGRKDKMVTEIWDAADKAGLPRKPVYYASKELGVIKRLMPDPDGKRGGAFWTWTLPEDESQKADETT